MTAFIASELLNGTEWGFRLTSSGVEWRDDSADEPSWRRLCGPLAVVADTRDSRSDNWGRLLAFADRDDVRHEWAASMAEISRGMAGEVISTLAAMGLEVPTSARDKAKLIDYITTAKPNTACRCVSRIGWDGDTFVLPENTFSATNDIAGNNARSNERVLFQHDGGDFSHTYRTGGTLDDWKALIAAPCAGNSRLVLALSCAFAGPLLSLASEESGGFHLRGGSSLGKSTALEVAASVWGGGGLKGNVQTWRATANGLEAIAARHCDAFLALDELGQADGRAAGEAAYLLANGQGKARANRKGSVRTAAEWNVIFLSSGELSLADKIASDGFGKRAMAGQEVRIIDLPADAAEGLGLFETLHDWQSPAKLADHLKRASKEFYGEASRAYLTWLVGNIEVATAELNSVRRRLLPQMLGPESSGQVSRVAARFTLVATAGELAVRAGVLPWLRGEAENAALRCFAAWLAGRGGSEPSEIREGIAAIRYFLERDGASRFQYWDDSTTTVRDRAGFWRRFDNDGASEGRHYFILPEVFKRDVLHGYDAGMIARAMVERGLIVADKAGRPSTSCRVPAMGKTQRLYQISETIFDG